MYKYWLRLKIPIIIFCSIVIISILTTIAFVFYVDSRVVIVNQSSNYTVDFANFQKHLQFYLKLRSLGMFRQSGIANSKEKIYKLYLTFTDTPQFKNFFVLEKGQPVIASSDFKVSSGVGYFTFYFDSSTFRSMEITKRTRLINYKIAMDFYVLLLAKEAKVDIRKYLSDQGKESVLYRDSPRDKINYLIYKNVLK